MWQSTRSDKNNANPGKILRELTEHDVIAETLGGDVQVVEISALKNTGIDDLLERIQLQAELMDEPLTAPVEGLASGVVIEARVDKGRGAVVTVLVQKGKLTPKQTMSLLVCKRVRFDNSPTIVERSSKKPNLQRQLKFLDFQKYLKWVMSLSAHPMNVRPIS